MAILKLKPVCKDYLWGGQKLITDYDKEFDGDKLAETWELSCHPMGPSVIEEGPGKGMDLREFLQQKEKEEKVRMLGSHVDVKEEFPILIKFIDAKEDLSIQVHPDDDYAKKYEGQYGKMEMWYILDCEEGATIYYGFAKEISKEEFAERIKNQTLLEVLNKVEVHKGDVFFVEPGTVHAIGKGIVTAEIQQNSNVTYRVYDYGRKDHEGNERELHIEQALKVTNYIPMVHANEFGNHIMTCRYFTVDKFVLDGSYSKEMKGKTDGTSFVSFLILDGAGSIRAAEESVTVKKGDSILVTADTGDYCLSGELSVLMTTV